MIILDTHVWFFWVNDNVDELRKDVSGFSFNDSQTINAIKDVYKKYNYIMDPHGAVGYLGLQDYLRKDFKVEEAVFLETAHPAKFKNVVENEITKDIDLPERLEKCLEEEKKSIPVSNNLDQIKNIIAEKNQ